MPDKLILNPFVNLFIDPKKSGKWIVQAPVPEHGLQRLLFDEAQCPTLYEMCEHSGENAVAMLDIYSDLDIGELSLLTQYGVITEPENVPVKPYFSCHIDTIDVANIAADTDLIVNPTMQFEAFDLMKFRTWGVEKNLSPVLPSVWVRNAQTGLRSGYWLDPEQAADVSRLRPGDPPCDLSSDLLLKLIATDVVISRVEFEAKDRVTHKKITEAADSFAKDGYSVLQSIVPTNQIVALQDFYRRFEQQGFMTLGDGAVPRRYVAPIEPLASTIHRDLAQLMSQIVGETVIPSYCYAAAYLEGADLKPHRDRPQCEFSFSMQIDYEPAPKDGISPWPLFLSDVAAGREVPIHLRNGDCLAYKGCELLHYRNVLPAGHHSTSLFLHYVPKGFSGNLI